jgi:DNA-binding transcriptional regulator YdaS (Cro superfamily)
MARDGIHAKTLARATRIVGGVDVLALQLGVEPATLGVWLRGEKQPPVEVFLRAVDIVVADSTRPERIIGTERDGGLNS